MNTYILNPNLKGEPAYIREGRCMQKASSWATAWPPISLALLATMAQKWGQAKVLDGNVESVTLEELIVDLKTFQADVVLVNTGFPSIDNDMMVAENIKKSLPQVKVIAFGVYFTMLEKEALKNHPFLDFCIVGEPEETFMEILEHLSGKKPDLSSISGLMYKDEQGSPVQTAIRPFIQNLDQLPKPDRGFLKNDRYRLPTNNKIFTLINTARGCPYPCTYCIVNTYYGRSHRKHSLDRIIEEIKECVEKYHIDEFLFWEEVFTLNKEQVLAFCEALEKNNLKIHWAATTRAHTLDEATIKAMKKAGCYLMGMGIESSSQEILDRAKKHQKVDQVRDAVNLCRRLGLKTMGHFIFGLPGETEQTAEATIDFMCSLGLDYMQCYSAVPYPKTELGEMAREKGWIRAERWSQFDFGGASIMTTDTLSQKQVDHYRTKAFFRFYFRPFYLLKRFFTDISLRQMFTLATFGEWMNLVRRKS